MTGPLISSFTFQKQRTRWVEPGTCYAIRSMTKTNHFCVLSREEISDMAAVSAINELLKAEEEKEKKLDERTFSDRPIESAPFFGRSPKQFEEDRRRNERLASGRATPEDIKHEVDELNKLFPPDDSHHMGPDD